MPQDIHNYKDKQYLNSGIITSEGQAIVEELVVKQSKTGFWLLVERIMKYLYEHSNPEVRNAMKFLEEEARVERESAYNDFGASKNLVIRKVCVVPDRLMIALGKVYGTDLPVSQKEFNEGMWRRYPKLRTSNKY